MIGVVGWQIVGGHRIQNQPLKERNSVGDGISQRRKFDHNSILLHFSLLRGARARGAPCMESTLVEL